MFTKIGKAIVNWLRKQGIRVVIYLDDFLIFGSSEEECFKNTKLTIEILLFLGFLIIWEKSIITLEKSCNFLGMLINSVDMTLELPKDKRIKVREMIECILRSRKIRIQNLAECIGVLVAACPGIAYGWLYYKQLELVKRNALYLYQNNTKKWTKLSK